MRYKTYWWGVELFADTDEEWDFLYDTLMFADLIEDYEEASIVAAPSERKITINS